MALVECSTAMKPQARDADDAMGSLPQARDADVMGFTLEAIGARVGEAARRLKGVAPEDTMQRVREVVCAQYHLLVCCSMGAVDSAILENALARDCFSQTLRVMARLITQARVACGAWPPAHAAEAIAGLAEEVAGASARLIATVFELGAPVSCSPPRPLEDCEGHVLALLDASCMGRESLLALLDEAATRITDSAMALLRSIHHTPSSPCLQLTTAYATSIGHLVSMVGDFRVCRYTETVYDSECLEHLASFFSAKQAVTESLDELVSAARASLKVPTLDALRSAEAIVAVAKALLAHPSHARFVVGDYCSLRPTEFQNSELQRLRAATLALTTPRTSPARKHFSLNLRIDTAQAKELFGPRPHLAKNTPAPRPGLFGLFAPFFANRTSPRQASFDAAMTAPAKASSPPRDLTYITPSGKAFHPLSRTSPRLGFLASASALSLPLAPYAETLTRASNLRQPMPCEPFLGRDYADLTRNVHGSVTGGTLDSLVEYLTPHDATIDADYTNTFLLTFRSFCTPDALLAKLVARFALAPPAGLAPAQLRTWRQYKLLPVQLRVFNILKTWLESYFFDDEDSLVLERIGRFAQGPAKEALPSGAAAQLRGLVQDRITCIFAKPASAPQLSHSKSIDRLVLAAHALLPAAPPPTPQISRATAALLLGRRPFSLLHLPPVEVARQLTILDARIFCAIKPSELINREFSKPQSTAMFVRRMTQNSTCLTSLVTRLILGEALAKPRAAWVKFFIRVAEQLLALQNYNTLVAVICGLQASPIVRLRHTWKLVARKHRASLDRLHAITNHARNYHALRQHLRSAAAPCLPFLGIYLTDLTFADEGNPTYRPTPDGAARFINFSKCQRTVRIIQEVQRFQAPYNLIEVAEIQDQLARHLAPSHWSEAHLYRQSLKLEPRAD